MTFHVVLGRDPVSKTTFWENCLWCCSVIFIVSPVFIASLNITLVKWTRKIFKSLYIWDALRDWVSFALFKKREKQSWRNVTLVKLQGKAYNFDKSSTTPWIFFSRFLNCGSGTKSRKASHVDGGNENWAFVSFQKFQILPWQTLTKNEVFPLIISSVNVNSPLRISSVYVTKPAGNCEFGHIKDMSHILNNFLMENLSFCAVKLILKSMTLTNANRRTEVILCSQQY